MSRVEILDKILLFLYISLLISIPFSGFGIGADLNFLEVKLDNIYLFILFLIAIFLFLKLRIQKKKILFPPLFLPFLLILGVTAFSLFSHFLFFNSESINIFLTLCIGFLLYFLLFNSIKDLRDIKYIEWTLLLIFTLQGILALIQFIHPVFINNPVDVLVGERIITRAEGVIGHPGPFGVFMAMIWPLAFCKVLFSEMKFWKLFFKIIILISGSVGILVSLTRSAWIGIFISLLIIILYYLKYKKKTGIPPKKIVLILTISMFLFIIFSFPLVKNRLLASDSYRQLVFRWHLDRLAFKMLQEHPLFGVGVGYSQIFSEFYYPGSRVRIHNQYLFWLVEYGITGFVFFLWFIFSCLKLSHTAINFSKDSHFLSLRLGINTMLWSLLVINNSGLAMSHISIFLLFCFLMGLVSIVVKMRDCLN